jgi:hypothetical protein
MGWSVSEHSEPSRKLDLFERRLATLRGAVKRGEGPARLSNAADKLRLAGLSVIKAKLALIREYPRRDPRGRVSAHLRDEELRWRSLSAEAIIAEYGWADA